MNTVVILLLVALGANPVELPKGPFQADVFAPVAIEKCDRDVMIVTNPPKMRCLEGFILYRDGKVIYEGPLPINEAVEMLIEQDKTLVDTAKARLAR